MLVVVIITSGFLLVAFGDCLAAQKEDLAPEYNPLDFQR